jgi:TolB-like protein/tetratricopeptide (TPR) repeat protein
MLIAAAVALIAVGAVALWSPWRARPSLGAPAVSATPIMASIAVLPFADMSQAKDQEYFSDGLSEELLDLLAKIPQLHVAGRTSAFAFKGKADDLRVIGHKLNVATVLEGSVRRSGDKIRITTQLINVADGYHLWSETYDRQMTDIFTVQDEIAGAVVAALKIKLLPDQHAPSVARRSANTDAYVQYLLGRQNSTAGTDEMQRAKAAYERAIALDPSFAAAYAGLALAELSSVYFARDPIEVAEAKHRASAAADQAVALDPGLADAYVARASVRSTVDWNWPGAMSDYQRALAISPGDSNALDRYAFVLSVLGRLPEAIVITRKAIELDPLSSRAWLDLGYYLNASGQFAAAREPFNRALEIAPSAVLPRYNLGIATLRQGDAAAALAVFERIPEGDPFRLTGVAVAERALGHAQQSQRAMDALMTLPAPQPVWVAAVYADRSDKNKAFEWLERAYQQHDAYLIIVPLDALFAGLRNDRRYAELLAKLGLARGS